MKLLLSVFVVFMVASQTFNVDASLMPGLSVKNALLYVAAAAVLLQYVVRSERNPGLLGVQFCFVFLVCYAIISLLVIALAVRYPGYDILYALINLKLYLIDHVIVFAVFYFGLRRLGDALLVERALVGSVGVASVITVLDGSGLLGLNVIAIRTESFEVGRVQGAFGEANQHAAMMVMFAPAMCAHLIGAVGWRKMLWLCASLSAVAGVMLTSSRGAMVGAIVAALAGAYVFRGYLSVGKVVAWFIAIALATGLILAALGNNYTNILAERVLGLTFSGDAIQASSGRTFIWASILEKLSSQPVALMTGFGWSSYSAMGFEYAPHNTYLGYWFNLGLFGLLAYVALFAQILGAARKAVAVDVKNVGSQLIAFWVGFVGLLTAIFFVELGIPWFYVWAYAGTMCRVAVVQLREPSSGHEPALVGGGAPSPPRAHATLRTRRPRGGGSVP
jgi:O-antigen ligase